MRQIGNEDDPLKRIQDEINEVARRERELREKTQRQQQQLKIQQQQQQQQQILQNNNEHNNINSTTNHIQHLNNHNGINGTLNNTNNTISLNSTISLNDESSSNNTSISPIITNSKDTNLDVEHHSDDSGISASSSPIPRNVKKYIRTNNYNVISPTPPPQQMQLNKPIIKSSNNNNNNNGSINNINNIGTTIIQQNGGNITQRPSLIHFTPIRRVTTGPAHKGLMQRFIATRGKISINGTSNGLNGIHTTNGVNGIKDGPISPIDQFNQTHRHSVFLQQVNNPTTPPIIERDPEGKPLRPGYIPVEEKIQKELKDLKNRESELKRIRKLKSRQSQPDLLESIENEFAESDEDSDVEHCYPPGKLRAVKSISELCDSMNSSSLSPSRTTPSPNFERSRHQSENLRPAVSLAQLCELNNDEEAPSSHELIAKWESLIQQNS
ncbi:myb-like protein I isoform X2 [Condylostylus longicornis]|uniref:myb-like protein I isoform X2 n=1 Tax=Condylostylus longicornis TaxID=2530218 RepID=UPI00244DA494|nr:myb-like protein I isoform X2 [Condylostylus longicornis]